MLSISSGPLNISGGPVVFFRGLVVPPSQAFIYAPTTDFGGLTFPITLDSGLITGPGTYALVYSPVPLTSYVGAGAITWVGSPTGTATVITGAGGGTYIDIGGTKYFAVVVTVV
jgi:hypothetical protein